MNQKVKSLGAEMLSLHQMCEADIQVDGSCEGAVIDAADVCTGSAREQSSMFGRVSGLRCLGRLIVLK